MVVDAVGLVRGEYGAFRGIFGASDFARFQKPQGFEPHQSRLKPLFGASGRVGGGKRGMRRRVAVLICVVGLVFVRVSFGLSVLLGCKKTIPTPTTATNKEMDNLMIKRLVRGNPREGVDLSRISLRGNEPKNETGDKPNRPIITMRYSTTLRDVRINTHPPSKNPSASVSPATLGGYIFWLKIRVLKKKASGRSRSPDAYPPAVFAEGTC